MMSICLLLGCVIGTGHEQHTWCLLPPTRRQRRNHQAAVIRQHLHLTQSRVSAGGCVQTHLATCGFQLCSRKCQHARSTLMTCPKYGFCSRDLLCCWNGMHRKDYIIVLRGVCCEYLSTVPDCKAHIVQYCLHPPCAAPRRAPGSGQLTACAAGEGHASRSPQSCHLDAGSLRPSPQCWPFPGGAACAAAADQ